MNILIKGGAMNDLNSVFMVGTIEEVNPDYLILANYRQERIKKERTALIKERFQVKLNKFAQKWISKVGPGKLPGSRVGINGRLAISGDRVYIEPFSLQQLDQAGA
jgi:hypothetical protein